MEPNDCTTLMIDDQDTMSSFPTIIQTQFARGKYCYLIYREGEDLKIAFGVYVETRKRLVISNTERGEGFIKVQVKPIDANVEVAPKNQ